LVVDERAVVGGDGLDGFGKAARDAKQFVERGRISLAEASTSAQPEAA
jgi:hypothetical protein